MQMRIIVETEEEFNKWMESQKTFEETVLVEDEAPQAFNMTAGADEEMIEEAEVQSDSLQQ